MGKSKNVGLSVGASSILVIFVLLCLTTFATLSMVSANADYKLTQRAAQAVRNYYAADVIAEELLATISGELDVLSQSSSGQEYLSRAVAEIPATHPAVLGEFLPDGRALLRYHAASFSEGTQTLSVVLEVLAAPGGPDGYVKRLEWKVFNLPDEASEENTVGGLWDGEDEFLPLA